MCATTMDDQTDDEKKGVVVTLSTSLLKQIGIGIIGLILSGGIGWLSKPSSTTQSDLSYERIATQLKAANDKVDELQREVKALDERSDKHIQYETDRLEKRINQLQDEQDYLQTRQINRDNNHGR